MRRRASRWRERATTSRWRTISSRSASAVRDSPSCRIIPATWLGPCARRGRTTRIGSTFSSGRRAIGRCTSHRTRAGGRGRRATGTWKRISRSSSPIAMPGYQGRFVRVVQSGRAVRLGSRQRAPAMASRRFRPASHVDARERGSPRSLERSGVAGPGRRQHEASPGLVAAVRGSPAACSGRLRDRPAYRRRTTRSAGWDFDLWTRRYAAHLARRTFARRLQGTGRGGWLPTAAIAGKTGRETVRRLAGSVLASRCCR